MAKKPTKAETFQLLFPSGDVERFLAGDPLGSDDAEPPSPDPTDDRFREFNESDVGGRTLSGIRRYVQAVIPRPRVTYENHLWSISCLPSTSGNARLFTLNLPAVEVLYGEWFKDREDPTFFMNTSATNIPPSLWSDLRERHALEVDDIRTAHYRHDATNIAFGAEHLDVLLADPLVLRGARDLIIDRMQSGGTIYEQTASRALAAAVLA